MERRDGSQLEEDMSKALAEWLSGCATASEEMERVPDGSKGGRMKEEVVEEATRVEDGIVDRFGAMRMEGLSLYVRSLRWAVADSDIGRSHVVSGEGTLADAAGREQEDGVHLEVGQISVVISIQSEVAGFSWQENCIINCTNEARTILCKSGVVVEEKDNMTRLPRVQHAAT